MKRKLEDVIHYYLPYGIQIKETFNEKNEWILGKFNYYLFSVGSDIPILRPLSDLTKEIEVDGERFVPLKKFYREARLLLEKEIRITPGEIISEYLSFEIIEKLLSWHFDLFGLIESNQAIDINTIKTEGINK